MRLWSKPDYNHGCFLVDGIHASDLFAALRDILLIDTKGVNPEWDMAEGAAVPEIESHRQIAAYVYLVTIDVNVVLWTSLCRR
jgi:hypothetical protein